MALLDIFNDPTFALGAGLLAPTPNASFGGGLLQGLEAGAAMRAANNQSEIAQNQAELQQRQLEEELAARQRREAQASALQPLIQSVTDPAQKGLLQAASYGDHPITSTVGALQTGKFEPSAEDGFGGTGTGQYYNTYIKLLPKINSGTATPKEQLMYAASVRELSADKWQGSPETGYFKVPAPPLPSYPGAPQPVSPAPSSNTTSGHALSGAIETPSGKGGSTFVDYSRRLTKSEREGLRHYKTGEAAPIDITLGEVVGGDSEYITMSPADVERHFAGKSALGIVDDIENKAFGGNSPIFKPYEGFGSRASLAAKNYADYLGGQNVDLNLYYDSTKGYLSMIVRALGEKGTLATKDIDRVRPLIPQVFPLPDSPEIARAKIDSLREAIKDITGRMEREAQTPTGIINREGVPQDAITEIINRRKAERNVR